MQIGRLRGEQQQDVGIAGLHLLAREVEADLGGAFEGARRSQRIGIVLQRVQHVGDVLRRADHRGLVGPRRLVIGSRGRAPLMQQGASVEDRLRDAAGEQPKLSPQQSGGRNQAGKRDIHITAIGTDGEIREHVGGGDADLRAGRVQKLFRAAHVGTLLDQLKRQAQRQVQRELQIREPERLEWPFTRVAAGQRRQ